jgi:hypothetical protein
MGRSCGLVFNKLIPIKITKHINLKCNDHFHYKGFIYTSDFRAEFRNKLVHFRVKNILLVL